MADFASCPVVMAGFKAPSQGGKWVLIDLTLLPGAPRGGDEIGGGGGGRSWSESPPLIRLPCCFVFSSSSGPGGVAFLPPSPPWLGRTSVVSLTFTEAWMRYGPLWGVGIYWWSFRITEGKNICLSICAISIKTLHSVQGLSLLVEVQKPPPPGLYC